MRTLSRCSKLCASAKLEGAVLAEVTGLQALDKFPRTFRGLRHYYRGKKFPAKVPTHCQTVHTLSSYFVMTFDLLAPEFGI